MTLVTPQAEHSASETSLLEAISLSETIIHLENQIVSLLHSAGLRPAARCQQEAPDIAQQCLKIAWSKRSEYHSALGEPGAWLHGIARRLTYSHLRSLNRWPQSKVEDDLLTNKVMQHHRDTLNPYDCEKVNQLLPQLSETDQNFIRRFYLEEMPLEQVMADMKLTSGAARTGKSRALKKLRELYLAVFMEDAS